MTTTTIILVIIGVILLCCMGFMFYLLKAEKRADNIETLMNISKGTSANRFKGKDYVKKELEKDEIDILTEAKRRDYKKSGKNEKQTELERYFQAGLLNYKEQEKFKKIRLILPIVTGAIAIVLGLSLFGVKFGVLMGLAGVIFGVIAPGFWLDHLIRKRSDEIMFYLPLVIEQIAIGVSSSLDVGPCLQSVVAMADERDSHNVVTELLYNVQRYVKSGVGLEESLTEIGTRSGHAELKHSFMALAQVAKHGGEISSQLQELANAVSSKRETMIDGKIKTLELKATGPVAIVLMSFIVTLLIGIFIRITQSI